MSSTETNTGRDTSATGRWLPALVLLAFAIVIVTGVWFYRDQERSLQKRAEVELEAIAELKIDQIVSWREQHMRTAERLSSSRIYAENIAVWAEDPRPETAGGILQRMRAEQPSGDYFDVILLDTSGRELLRLGERERLPVHDEVTRGLAIALRDKRPVLVSPHIIGDLPPHVDVVAPLFYEKDGVLVSPGAVILQADLGSFLYPLVQSWPTPSESAETLLVEREGDEVVYLSELRHAEGAALTLRIPLDEPESVSAMAARGVTGIVEGRDYRGERVLAYLSPVPDSDWFMVAKVDVDEAYADWRSRAGLIIALVLGLNALVGGSALLVSQRTRAARLAAQLEAERVRRETDARLSSLFRAAPLGIGVVLDRVFVELNDKLCEMLGYELEELVGNSSRMIYPSQAEYEWVGEVKYRQIAESGVGSVETRFQRKDGTVIEVLLRSAPIRNGDASAGVSFTALDITERKRAEEAMRSHGSLMESLVAISDSRVGDATAVLDTVTREAARLTESATATLYGYDEDTDALDMMACTASEAECCTGETERGCCALGDRACWRRAIVERRPITLEPGVDPPADGCKSIRALIVPVSRGDRIVAAIGVSGGARPYDDADIQHLGVLGDAAWKVIERLGAEAEVRRMNESLEGLVSERTEELQETNEELQRIADELAATNEELTEANEAKGRFLRSMSHELRTPLNSVIGFSDLMLGGLAGDLSTEQRRQLEMINHSGKHLLALINDILDLSRIEAGRVELKIERFEPTAIATEAIESVALQAREKGLELSFEAPEPELTMSSDPVKVRQIVLNLLGNAIKFTDAGSVTLRVSRAAPGMIAFTVADTGPGIPHADHDRIFGEFTQRYVREGDRREGSGLGLAISRGLAALLGGALTVSSDVGEGSTFTLLLPEKHVRPAE